MWITLLFLFYWLYKQSFKNFLSFSDFTKLRDYYSNLFYEYVVKFKDDSIILYPYSGIKHFNNKIEKMLT